MFMGQYQHNIDMKGRLTRPSRFRELIADGAYIIQGFDRNLMVLTSQTFENISSSLSRMNMTDPSARLLSRLVYAHGGRLEVDKAGRILIPDFLRQNASLEESAIVVGVGEYFEIWSPEEWNKQVMQIKDTDANAQRFVAFNLSSG